MAWQLSKRTMAALWAGRDALNAELEILRNRHDRQSKVWREGDEGTTVLAWLETLDLVVEAVEDVNATPKPTED